MPCCVRAINFKQISVLIGKSVKIYKIFIVKKNARKQKLHPAIKCSLINVQPREEAHNFIQSYNNHI